MYKAYEALTGANYTHTVFIRNLPYFAIYEDARGHFEESGFNVFVGARSDRVSSNIAPGTVF
jgi:hypothetical protein